MGCVAHPTILTLWRSYASTSRLWLRQTPCQSRRSKTAVPGSPGPPLSLSIHAATPVPAETAGCCCDSHCSPGNDADTAEESDRRGADSYPFSWQVSGMDCPSCARTIETAVRQVSGVTDARVLFSSEKLVVNADQDVQNAVEQAVKKPASSSQPHQPRRPHPPLRRAGSITGC